MVGALVDRTLEGVRKISGALRYLQNLAPGLSVAFVSTAGAPRTSLESFAGTTG